jgi:hypothetical protein
VAEREKIGISERGLIRRAVVVLEVEVMMKAEV